MANHPIEALLRPPVELNTGIVSLASASIAALAPEAFMVTPAVAYGGAIALTGYGLWWLRQGFWVVRYQNNLRKAPRFEMSMRELPVSQQWLYLGKGFAWQERHTQRLHDSRRTRFKRFVDHSRFYYWIRRNEKAWEHTPLYPITRSQHWLNPVKPLPPTGGNTVLHGVELDEHDIHMPLDDRTGHTLVLGTTRVGKTRGAELMIAQDIRRGDVVIVIDPKGDADLLARVRSEAERAGRGDSFYMFHLGYPEISARYNAIGSFSRITEVASRLSGQLSGEGNSAVFREFAWRFVNIIAKALVALGVRPNYKNILTHVTNIDGLFWEYATFALGDKEGFMAQVEARAATLNDRNTLRHLAGRPKNIIAMETLIMERGFSDDVLDGLRSALKYEKSYFDKIVASLLPLLEKLTTGKIAELLSPDYEDQHDPRPIFDWRQVVNQKAVVYVGLDALSDSAVSAAVGNSMFADLVSYCGQRYKHGDSLGLSGDSGDASSKKLPRICLHCDEFNELMGDEFIPMVNKGGGAGLQVTAYSQALADVMAKIGNRAKAAQVVANFNNLIMYRVKEEETARLLTDQLPQVEVSSLTLVSGYNDTSDPDSDISFTSRYEDRITHIQTTMVEPQDVMKLPKGQAFALLEGGHLKKIRLPLPKNPSKNNKDKFELSFDDMLIEMRERYRSTSTWWEAGT
jgi:conjugative coupling factor TraD (TOL family)